MPGIWNKGDNCGHLHKYLVDWKRALHICHECLLTYQISAKYRQVDCPAKGNSQPVHALWVVLGDQ